MRCCGDELADDEPTTGAPIKAYCERVRGHRGEHISGKYSWDQHGWAINLLPKDVYMPRDLTEREMQILKLVAYGLDNNEIGQQLYIAPDTVKSSLQRLYRLMDVRSRAGLVTACFRAGVLS